MLYVRFKKINIYIIVSNRPVFPWIVLEIVLLSRHPGNLPNVPGSLANWPRFQAPVSLYVSVYAAGVFFPYEKMQQRWASEGTCSILQFAEFSIIIS